MKKLTLAIAVLTLALPAVGAFAQQKTDDMKGMDMPKKPDAGMPAPSKQTTHMAKGIVKKVDAKTGMVTVAHGPVQSLNWPAMTMAFKVKDKALLNKFSDGKEVEFEFAKQGERYVIESVK
jgi:Cu(I)/Ag(I) efflux system protein CusF